MNEKEFFKDHPSLQFYKFHKQFVRRLDNRTLPQAKWQKESEAEFRRYIGSRGEVEEELFLSLPIKDLHGTHIDKQKLLDVLKSAKKKCQAKGINLAVLDEYEGHIKEGVGL